MKFCQRHWDLMRAAVESRGMTPLVADSGASAAANFVDEFEHGLTIDNFDPLMAMHWNIATNLLDKLGSSAGYLMFGGEDTPEDPIDVERLADAKLKAKYRGKTWPRCPICYANIAHEFTCRETKCMLAQVDGYDACIEWSADAIRQKFDRIMQEAQR